MGVAAPAIGTGLGIVSLIQGGKAESRNMAAQAKSEKFNAKNREIERKRNLVDALAMQNVMRGASGITGGVGSSAEAVMKEDVRREKYDTSVDAQGTSMRTTQLMRNASNARKFSLLSAAGEGFTAYGRYQRRGSS